MYLSLYPFAFVPQPRQTGIIWEGPAMKSDWVDMFVNFVVFLPIGFLAARGMDFYFAQNGIARMAVLVSSMTMALYLSGLYADTRIPSRLRLLHQICFPVGLAFLFQAALGFVNRDWIVPRKAMIGGSTLVIV